jgi:hypothetical protein
MRAAAVLLAVPLAGLTACNLYFELDGDDDCDYGGQGTSSGTHKAQAALLRNPDTGMCEEGSSGGGGGDLCTGGSGDTRRPPPDWGACESFCTGLDELTCQATAGCRAAYLLCDAGPDSRCFAECWATAPSGAPGFAPGEGCEGLSAYECSRHDDCMPRHRSGGGGALYADPIGPFEDCMTEPVGCYSDDECGPGLTCNSEEVCLPPPGCASGTGDAACPRVCYGQCVPGPDADRGDCYSPVYCRALPPGCPPDSVPGRRDGCWTGACIPVDECGDPPPPAACIDIADEASCIASELGCTPIYVGKDCTCDDAGCSCAVWEYDHCE